MLKSKSIKWVIQLVDTQPIVNVRRDAFEYRQYRDDLNA